MTHLLDTSAVLAHFLDEPGAGEVDLLLREGPETAALAAPSWAELDRRLSELIPAPSEARRVFGQYTRLLCGFVPLDAEAVQAAIEINRSTPTRLPMIDSLIAGCAANAGLVLVHRDPHMDAMRASERILTMRLPDKFRTG
jgi:predicted nucleic acid-binding protein